MGPKPGGDLSTAVIRREVTGVQFGIYTDTEVKSRSVVQITSPQAFDTLGTPLPSGLYDPLLGPSDARSGSCLTCANPFLYCPGHYGHIELCVPLYHPLLFPKLLSLLRLKCYNCHRFRLAGRAARIFEAKLHLLDCGLLNEAEGLDEEITRARLRVNADLSSDTGGSKASQAAAAAAQSIDSILASKLSTPRPTAQNPIQLTSHERSVRRQLIKEFTSTCNGCKKCDNCKAVSPKIRQDSSNKIFWVTLSNKDKRSNVAERVKIVGALESMREDGEGGGGGYDSDDSVMQEQDEDAGMQDHENEEGGVDNLFDDEAQEANDADDGTGGYKKRESTIAKGGGSKDKYLHSLEIQAQVRLTWETQPNLCCQIFGNAHEDVTSPDTNKPKGWGMFFLQNVPVPPARFRPPMVLGTMTVEHAQNFYLNKVLELNDRVRNLLAISGSTREEGDEGEGESDDGDSDDDGGREAAAKKKAAAEASERAKSSARALSTWIDLQTTLNCYMDSSKDPSASAGAENVPNGIRQLLEKKEGIFRKNMMGKRVNFACRSVISPDPYIGTNEIGLPLYFAKTLTYPTPVTERNVEEMRRLVQRGPEDYPGAVWVEFPDGRRVDLGRMSEERRISTSARLLPKVGLVKVGRQLRNGDMVLMNRQPTLHKPGIMAHYVRVLYSRTQTTLRMHYANCNTYNADYDGDEMNCHFPQNDLARAESEFIASADLQFIVPTDGSPLRGLIQDHVDAGVKLTGKDTFLEKWEYQQLIFASLTSLSGLEIIEADMDIELMPPAIRKPQELWTGKQVITTLLHHLSKGSDKFDMVPVDVLPGVSMERKTKTPPTAFGAEQQEHLVLVRDGELLRGVLDKAAFGATDFSLVHAVYEAYGPNKAGLFLNALGRLFTAYLQYYSGHSCRMEDLVLTAEADAGRRNLVKKTYNLGARAAKAWADSDGGKVEIPPIKNQPGATEPLKPVEAATAAAKIGELLSGKEGQANFAALDGYMQSQLNPLASEIIKSCLPNGLAVPFPANTFGLMVTTGAKGSMVNQSQVSCALGQQALEGRRVPRMSSGKTLPSFMPYDPNPRADGFIADRFLTGVRPQEYYFHCMAGREGLVDTAVKTSRSGYLQRCLVKHLEELKVSYDSTVRDGEGGVIQFLYGEDGIDPTKAPHLDCSSRTFQYLARNHKALDRRYAGLPNSTIDVASSDYSRAQEIQGSESNLLKKGSYVKARKLRVGSKWKRGALCRGWFDAVVTKVHSNKRHFDLTYTKDQSCVSRVPAEVAFDHAGGRRTPAASNLCTLIRPSAPDPILSDVTRDQGKHRLGSSGACVSERVAGATTAAIQKDKKVQAAIKSSGISNEDFGRLVAKKYGSALCAPGEAVGSIAAQGIGEPSTQMTLNTFHLAGAGANVTLGIPRLREIIMTASRELKTPTMSVPLDASVTAQEATRLTRYFTKVSLNELLTSHGGIAVTTSLEQNAGGQWERAYQVKLMLHSKERISEAFGLRLEDIASVVAKKFIPNLAKQMKMEMKRSSTEGTSTDVLGGAATDFVYDAPTSKSRRDKDDEDVNEDDEYDDEVAGEEDGVTGRFGHKQEMTSYGDMDDAEKEIAQASSNEPNESNERIPATVTDDEGETDKEESAMGAMNTVTIDYRNNALVLQALRVDPSVRPLLMVGLVERSATSTLVSSRPKLSEAYINNEDGGRGRCLQTAGVNFEEMWKLSQVDHNRLASNDIWAIRCAYGVEAARRNIGDQIRGVFAVYGIEVDPRHLSLIADYMTFDGGYKAMNRIGMIDASSPFLQMSFETTANFMVDAALNKQHEPMMSPSANIVLGRPVQHGTGAFECIVKA